jgi:dTDP-3-amino-3,4,6-trideoxy-alpha-D-glucose transaminase
MEMERGERGTFTGRGCYENGHLAASVGLSLGCPVLSNDTPAVPMNDFRAQIARRRAELQAAIDRVLDSGWFILGPEVEAFEREYAAFVGVPHAVGVANGMDAITLALEALGVGPGHEVITTPNSAFATALAVVRAGATPVFVDVDPDTCALDPARVAAAVTPRTRALLPVHIYGHPFDMEALAGRGIPVVGDAAQAQGAQLRGRDVATYGAVTATSFYPTKNLGALGDGGLVATGDAALAARVRQARDYGQAGKYQHVTLGLNSRLDELQAAILRVKLRHLPQEIARRQAIAERYTRALGELPLTLPRAPAFGASVWHLFTVRTPRRDQLQAFLKAEGITTLVHYPLTIPLQPALAHLGHRPGSFPVAERVAAEILSLPIDPVLDDARIDRVAEAIRRFFQA